MAPPRIHRLIGALCALTVGCTSPTPADGYRASLTGGTDDDGDPAVVAILGAELGCTGTLVSDRAVLTAAHCGAQSDPSSVGVFFGSVLAGSGTRVPVLTAVVHPDFDDTADHDLALLLLSEPAPAEPVTLAAEPVVEATPPVPVRLVGFGRTAADASDEDRKREGSGAITEATSWHVVLGADPSLPCLGDSGGPVLATTDSGERLVGVVSRGDVDCLAQSKATRVDAHLAGFIRPHLDAWAAGDIPGQTGDACVSDDDCLRGACLEEEGICSVPCVRGSGDCAEGFACEHLGGVDFYCLPEPSDSGGCAASGASRDAPALLGAAVLVALGWRRRRVGP